MVSTTKVSELACDIFSSWCLNNPSTINLTSIEDNVFRWVFWQDSQIKNIVVLIKGCTKSLENLYFHKDRYGKGLMLKMPCHTQITHIIWVDIQSSDSALIPVSKLLSCLRKSTNCNDFNSFKSGNDVIYVVPLDYLEEERIGVRRRNLLPF